MLELSPILKTANGFEKITSFSVTYQNTPFRNSSLRSATIYNSILSQGAWYQFAINESGIYRLDRNFLQSLGIPVSGLNPNTIKIYGYGGDMLPLENFDDTPLDPVENAIKVIGAEDGVFDTEDYILFYGRGQRYNEDSRTHINAYTDQTIYYIQIGGSNGLRVNPLVEPTSASVETLTTFVDYQFHEVDQYNIANLGRRWFGERFDFESQQEFLFDFPNLMSNELAEIRVVAAATSEVNTNLQIALNGSPLGQINFSGNSSQSSALASGSELNTQASLSSEAGDC